MKYAKLGLAIVLLIIATHTKSQNQKPNIILILADDLGYKALTCDGGNLYSTPNIDALAKKGMRFTQCHASPKCSPSRFLLLTGKYNFRNYRSWGIMTRDQKTIGNMMKDAGYKTGVFGKWQLDGGDLSIHTFGFDDYCLWNVYSTGMLEGNTKYKNPEIFTHGAYLSNKSTLNKYGPDIFSDSLLRFIENNESNPFFIFYPAILTHHPFCPTPDDSAFATWDPTDRSDTTFFPSMIHYMDKQVGQIINKIKSLGIEDNTVIIFTGDNGTSQAIIDYVDENDSAYFGGKTLTTETGLRVPLIVCWPGKIKAGTENSDLVDFTDFLPTLAGIAGIPVPDNYGPLDGVSFAPRLFDQPGTPRDWIFYHYDYHPGPNTTCMRWAQTKRYKLYDTCNSNKSRLFYNIDTDAAEISPILKNSLTTQEAKIKKELLDVINNYIAQGTPLISLNPSLLSVTDTSALLKDTIDENGGSTVTASGAVWSTKPNPEISSCDHTTTGKMLGHFRTWATGLTPGTTYYMRAYATNFAGTAYSNQVIFKTLSKMFKATPVTSTDSARFASNSNGSRAGNHYLVGVRAGDVGKTINVIKQK